MVHPSFLSLDDMSFKVEDDAHVLLLNLNVETMTSTMQDLLDCNILLQLCRVPARYDPC